MHPAFQPSLMENGAKLPDGSPSVPAKLDHRCQLTMDNARNAVRPELEAILSGNNSEAKQRIYNVKEAEYDS